MWKSANGIFTAEFVIGGLAVTLWLAWRDPALLKECMGGPFRKGEAFLGQQGIHGVDHRLVVWSSGSFSWRLMPSARALLICLMR